MMLTENAFAVLGAMPVDNRRVLNEKADEAALLGGEDTEAALNQLMQMNRRITAELGWLPASSAAAAESFLRYASTVSQGQHAKLPPLEGLSSALAQANALAALFEIWPADRPELFIGLCRALDGILSRVTAGETLQEINADRTAGGWEAIPDATALLGPLNERLRELCAPAARAMEKLNQEAAVSALKVLYGPQGIDVQGSVAEAVGDAYSMRIHEKADGYRDSIRKRLDDLKAPNSIASYNLDNLRSVADGWCALTEPLRMKPGTARNEAKSMGQGIRNVIVEYVNKFGTEKKSKVFRFPVFNGTKTVTIQYNSQEDAVNKALEMGRWLARAFPEQTELQELLKDDTKTLNDILTKEREMLAKAEIEARYK